jgi:hypothetical protein
LAETDLAADLAWWRAGRGLASADRVAMAEVLARLKSWQAQHDQDRAGQPGPFLKMAWDAVFGDENGRVAEAVAEIEAALGAPSHPQP